MGFQGHMHITIIICKGDKYSLYTTVNSSIQEFYQLILISWKNRHYSWTSSNESSNSQSYAIIFYSFYLPFAYPMASKSDLFSVSHIFKPAFNHCNYQFKVASLKVITSVCFTFFMLTLPNTVQAVAMIALYTSII